MRPLLFLLAVSALSLGACGDDNKKSADKSPPTQTQTAKSKAEKPKKQASAKAGPEVCLIRGGASNVEQRSKDLWRGSTDNGLLLVHKFGSASEAEAAAKAATDIES